MLTRKMLLPILLCVCVSTAGLIAGSASALAATMILTVGSEPVESITTQLGAEGMTSGTNDVLILKVKAAGGEGCAANASADDGEEIISPTGVGSGPTYSDTSNNHTFSRRRQLPILRLAGRK